MSIRTPGDRRTFLEVAKGCTQTAFGLTGQTASVLDMMRRVTALFSVALSVAGSCRHGFAAQPVEFNRSADRIEVLIGGRPFTTYYFGSAPAKSVSLSLAERPGHHRHARLSHGKRTFRAKTMMSRTSAPCTSLTATSMGTTSGERRSFPAGAVTLASTFGRTVFRKLDEMQWRPRSRGSAG